MWGWSAYKHTDTIHSSMCESWTGHCGLTLKKKRAGGADFTSGVRLCNGSTIGGGVDCAVLCVEDCLGRHLLIDG